MLNNMAVQKTAWAPNTILKPHCSHQSNDCFCGLENIQAAMSCSGILGGGIHGAIYGRGDNCFAGPNGRSENDGKRVGGVRGNVGGVTYDSRNAASNNEPFVRDGMQKFPPGHEGPYTLFSNLESRNPLLESMTVNPLQSSEISDGGQFSPGSGRNSGMRQNLDELVSKILDEDPSQSARQMDEAFGIGLEDKRPSHGLLSVTNSDFSENVRNIWSFDGKPPIVSQAQHQQHMPSSISSGQFKVPLDNQWQVVRLAAEKPMSQGVATSGYHRQPVDSSVYSARKPAYGATGDNDQFLQQIGRQKFEGSGAASYGSLAMKPSSAEMDLALRCLEKSGPLASPRGVPSDAYGHYNAWPKMSNACSSQNLGGNPGLMVNCFPNGNPNPPGFAGVNNMGPAATSCESRPEVKSGMELLMGSNAQQAGGAAKQYLFRCFSQLGGSEEMRDGQLEAQQRQLLKSLQGSADLGGQNLMIPASMKVCAERNQADQSILYGIGGKAAAGSTVRNGHNVSMYPVGKYPLWSAAALRSGMVPSSALLNALAGEKKDSDMNGVPSGGIPIVDQSQQFGYGQPNGKKTGNYMSPAFVQGVSGVPLQPDLSQCSESIWCQLQDVPVFQAESLYPCQQQPSNGSGFQFDLSGIPKAVAQQNQIPLRGIQSQWINPPLHAADGCECGTRCDVHNIGRATPVILRPGEIFYNNMPPQAVFGLSQYMPDVKLKSCLTTSSSLLICLEDCFDQLRSLEKEGKEVENELMQHKIGKSLASVNSTSVPRLPSNPSRVNRLVVESLREHSKVIAILGKLKKIRQLHANIYSAMETWMEGIRKVQARRKEEIVSSANRSNSGGSRTQEEKDILALTAAVEELLSQTRRARTCLWCAVQISLYGSVLSSDKGAPAELCGSSAIYGLMSNDWCSADAGCFSGGQNGLKMEN